MAGWTGLEPGAETFSNWLMARDFWFQALESQAVTSLRFVPCRPPESSRFAPRRGDILETVPPNSFSKHQPTQGDRRDQQGSGGRPRLHRRHTLVTARHSLLHFGYRLLN